PRTSKRPASSAPAPNSKRPRCRSRRLPHVAALGASKRCAVPSTAAWASPRWTIETASGLPSASRRPPNPAPGDPPMDIAIPVYDRMTALDAIGPYEVLSRLPGARVRFVAKQPGGVTTETKMLTLIADEALEDVPAPDIIVVPGGIGTRYLLDDEQIIGRIRRPHETAASTPSVCTGSPL